MVFTKKGFSALEMQNILGHSNGCDLNLEKFVKDADILVYDALPKQPTRPNGLAHL